MAWRAVHPENTEAARIPDVEGAPTFQIGFWPPRIAERIDMTLSGLRKKGASALLGLDPVSQQKEFTELLDASFDLVRDMVRYGVRGWSGFDGLEAKLEAETIDQRPHHRLSAESLELLYANRMLQALAARCLAYNSISDDQKKTSGSPSASSASRNPTGAESAIDSGTQIPSLSGSDSRASSSKDAPSA